MGCICFIIYLCKIVYSFVTKSIIVAKGHLFIYLFCLLSSTLKIHMQVVCICFILACFIRNTPLFCQVCVLHQSIWQRRKLFVYSCQHGVWLLSNFYHILIIQVHIIHSYLLEMHKSVFQWLEFVFVGAFTSPLNSDIQGRHEGRVGGKERDRKDTERKLAKGSGRGEGRENKPFGYAGQLMLSITGNLKRL